ncbi:MAG TPA: lanthionine synthetase C family protein [Gemmatimonadaceae bacterium]|nr:lanthionine synthetase C family protein [Gemmatimonadaceae bacterium]
MSWKPLLDGTQRDAALAAVREIGTALTDPPPCSILEPLSENGLRIANASLSVGRAGTALGFGYLSVTHEHDPAYAAAARRLIAESAQSIAGAVAGPTLYGGFIGIGWVLAKLRAWNVVAVGESSFASVDKALLTYVDREDWPHAVELIYGLAGCLVYALARLPNPDAMRVIELGLRAIEASAEENGDGITWFVPASHLRSATLLRAPEGCYNLGVSHGNPGIISVLAELHRLGIDAPRTKRLLEGSVAWLLAQEVGDGWFPSLTGPGVVPKLARVSWCYGSPGIPIALLRAARALDRDDWHATALRLATVAANVPFERSGVIDPPFCHGAAGLMHQFNRLYQDTGVELFADAARRWFGHTMSYRVEGEGVAGFSSRSMPEAEQYPEPGMLFGAAGIASVFAAAVSDVEPSWDAMFALSDAGTA